MRLPVNRAPRKSGPCPSRPLPLAHRRETFGDAPRHRQHQRNRHVSSVVGGDVRRVRHDDAPLTCCCQVHVVDSRPVMGDQLEPPAGPGENAGVDPVGDGRYEHLAALDGVDQFGAGHRRVVVAKLGMKKLRHPRLDALRQSSCYDNTQTLRGHRPPLAPSHPSRSGAN